jgi:DNA-binding transcriptional regulator GbsR (MarR family)
MQNMPGARLTYQDREQISAWLTAGLGYAEIARRLGRPTSTISREVARNHDSGDYRAGRAQQAAAKRAPRRRPAPASQPAGFAEEFAGRLARTGLPRMCARVFAGLLVSESGSLTASDLAQRLSVSPASISKAVGYLEEMNLLSRTPDAGTRRERYVIGDDVWQRAWQTDTGAHAAVAEAAQRGVELFGAESPAGIRLRKMGQFFGWLAAQMTGTAAPPIAPAAQTTGPTTPPAVPAAQPTPPALPAAQPTPPAGHTTPPAANTTPPTVPAAQTATPPAAHRTATDDPVTVVSALMYAARPLTADELATALGWPLERVAACLDPARLTPAQRAALRPQRGESSFTSGKVDAERPARTPPPAG